VQHADEPEEQVVHVLQRALGEDGARIPPVLVRVKEGDDRGPEIEGYHHRSTVRDDGGEKVRGHVVPHAGLLEHLQRDLEDPRQLHGHVPVVHRTAGIGLHVRVEPLLQPEVHLVLRPNGRDRIRNVEVEVPGLGRVGRDHVVVHVVPVVHGVPEELPSPHWQIGHPVVEPLRLGHLVGQDQGNEGTGVGAALLELAEARLAEVAREPPDIEVVDLLVNGHGDGSLVARGSAGAPRILCPAAS